MRIALGIARVMGLSVRAKFIIKYASLLHDIGKIRVEIKILKKQGLLTAREWACIKEHPKVGARIIKKAGSLDYLIPAVRYHHVRYAGGGYPRTRLKKSAIPIEARILAVADAYSSMTSDRPYRKRMSAGEARAELKRQSGTQFDPRVVKALFNYLKI